MAGCVTMESDYDTLPESYKNTPIAALRHSSRKKLSKSLESETHTFARCGVLPDYTGFAELLDFNYLEIQNFKQCENPTEAILQEWEQRHCPKPTVGKLVACLREMGREDTLTDCLPVIIRDVEAYLRNQKQKQSDTPIQDDTVTCTDHDEDESRVLTVQDVQEGCPQYYDAFVCYNPEGQDLAFVKEMLEVLESDSHKLRMFVPWRDDLPGSSTHTVSATLIQRRCKKMVIIMSPRYLACPACDFQTKFAQSLTPGSRSKKLVPVLIEKCDIPLILQHVTVCDFTNASLKDWSWDRLISTIKASIDSRELEYESDVTNVRLDLSSTSVEDTWE